MTGKWSSLLKVGAAAAVLLAAALAAAPFVLIRFFPPERVRALVEAQARKALRREVRLGDVSWSLIKGVTITNLAVSEAPDFGAGTFASMDSFTLRLRLLPLLSRRLVIDRVSAAGLKLNVAKRADGGYNFSDLSASTGTGAASPAAGAAAAAAAPIEFNVSRAALSRARVSYRDAATGDSAEFSEIDASARDLRLSGPFSAELSLKAAGRAKGRAFDGTLTYAGVLDLGGADPEKFSAQFKKLSVDGRGYRLDASGRVEGLKRPRLAVELAVKDKGGELLAGGFEGTLSPPGEDSPWGFEGSVKAKTAGLSAARLKGLGLPAGVAIPAGEASGKLDYRGDALSISALRLSAAEGAIDLSGAVSGLGTPQPSVDLAAQAALELPRLKSEDLPGSILPPGLALPASRVEFKARLNGENLALTALKIKTAAGTVEASGAARKVRSAKPDLDLALAAKLELPALKAAELPFLKLPPGFVSPAGSVDAKLRVKGDDVEIEALRAAAKAGTVSVSGKLRGALQGRLDPELDVTAKLELPALVSSDLPLAAIPPDLAIPASSWDAAFSASSDDLKIRTLRLIVGHNDLEVADGRVGKLRSGAPLFSVLFKCRSFDLAELTQLSSQTREMGLSGKGFFAMEVTGKWPRPILAGKMKFEGLGGSFSGLKLSEFTGTASFDEKRIDIPNLKGNVADGVLGMDLTVKNYAADPDVDLEATLTQFDLGRFLAAKQALAAPASAPAAAAPAAGEPAKPRSVSAKGRLSVDKLIHPSAEARDVKVSWELSGLSPDLAKLSGWAKLNSSGGKFDQIGNMATQSKLVKVLIMPLMIFQKIGRIGGLRLFPDFNNVVYTELAGDYGFADGVMDLKDSHLYSDAANVSAKGTIDLPAEKLDLTVTAQVARVAPIDVDVRGTFSQPTTKVKVGQFIQNIFKKQQP